MARRTMSGTIIGSGLSNVAWGAGHSSASWRSSAEILEAAEHGDGEKRIAAGFERKAPGEPASLPLALAPRRERRHQLAEVGERERLQPDHGAGDAAADLPLELGQLGGNVLARRRRQNQDDRTGPELLHGGMEGAERRAIAEIGLVEPQRQRRLVGDCGEERRERAGHFAPVLRLARLRPRGELRHQRSQHAQHLRVRRREPPRPGQAGPHQHPQGAPRRVLVAAKRPGRDHERAFQREPLEAVVEHAGLPGARLAGDQQGARAARQPLRHRPIDFGGPGRTPHQRRLGGRGRPLPLAPPMSPHPLRQRGDLPTGLLPDLPQTLGKLVVRLEGAGRVAGQSGGADREPSGRLGIRLEEQGAPRRLAGGREAPRAQGLFAMGDERGRTHRPEPGALGGGPVLEPRRTLDGEALEEVAVQQGKRLGWMGRRERGEARGVDLEVVGLQHDQVAPGPHPARAQAGSQAVERFVQGVPGARLVLLRPERAEHLISRAGSAGGQSQVDEEGQMLPPEDLGRSGVPADPRGRRTQAGEFQPGEVERRGVSLGVGHAKIWHVIGRPANPGGWVPSPSPVPAGIVGISGSPEAGPVTDLLHRLHSALAERYAVVRELGRGGTAVVFLARDLRTSRQVALKVLRPEVASVVGTERFLREIRLTSQLQHPHLLPLFDSGEADGCLYYSMPYVAGESLRARLWREGQLPLGDAVGIAAEVAQALAYAHGQGVIHRDIKPENILLQTDPEARALVADFGIAHALTIAGGEQLTATGVAIGTPAYMSPEQASHGRLDRRSDIYGLGCVLYEMLAGSPPFTGPTAQAVIARHTVDPVPSLRTVRPTVSPSLERVVMKALAKVPADRYADAAEFQEALRKSDTTEQTEVVPAARPERRRVARTAIGVAVAAAAITVAAVWARGRSSLHFHDKDWIVVADFDSPSDDPGLGDAVRELTTAELNQSRFLSTLPREQLDEAMRLANVPETTHVGPQLARELAYRSAVRAVVAGGVSRMGGANYSIVLHVVDAADGHDIMSVAGAASDSNLVTTVQRLARQVREGLGERRSAVEANVSLSQAATPSFAAYRRYVEGVELQDKGDALGSNRVLREALALDTGFASAWYLIGWNYLDDRFLDSARLAFAEALRRPDRLGLPRRYRVEGDVAYATRYDLPGAVRSYDLFLDYAPRSFTALNTRGLYLLALGRYEDALRDFERGVQVHPFGRAQAQMQLANQAATLVALGRIPAARDAVRDLNGAFGEYVRMMLAVATDQWAEADSIGSAAAAAPSSPNWLRVQAVATSAAARAARGAVGDAAADLERSAAAAPADISRWYDSGRLLLAQCAERPPGPLSATAKRDTTVPGLVTYGLWDAALGDTAAARRRLTRLRHLTQPELARLGYGPDLLEASLAARDGRWPEVIRLIGPAAAQGEHDSSLLDRVSSLSLRWLAAEAYARIGQPDSAIATMELLLRPTRMPGSAFALRGLAFPFAHRQLALWYTALGRRQQAATHWRAFLDAVRAPDAELAPQVQEARRAYAATLN